MPISKHCPQLQFHKRCTKKIHNRTSRQAKSDCIGQLCPLVVLRKSMLMTPIRKWPLFLFIDKESWRFANRMNCVPFRPDWPQNRHTDHQSRTGRDPAAARKHPDPLRGRRQFFKRVWSFVKSPNRFYRRMDVGRNGKFWHCT